MVKWSDVREKVTISFGQKESSASALLRRALFEANETNDLSKIELGHEMAPERALMLLVPPLTLRHPLSS